MCKYKDNNTAITNYSTEQTRTLGKYSKLSRKIIDHTRIMRAESKKINDHEKGRKKMKTGATADGGKKRK